MRTESCWNDCLLHEKWNRTTEKVLLVLIRSGLSREEKKRVLRAINGKWEDPNSVATLQTLADELLKKVDPTYAVWSKNSNGLKWLALDFAQAPSSNGLLRPRSSAYNLAFTKL